MKLLIALMLANPFFIVNDINKTSEPSEVMRADVREWKYEDRPDGHRYKRLFNYTTGKWETDWILVW